MSKINQKYLENFYLIAFFSISFLFVLQSFYEMPKYDHAHESEILYDYWFINKFQWGKDIVQNIGPYGWIHYPKTYTGFLDLENILINLFLTAISVFIFYEFSKHFNEKQKILYQFIFVLVSSQSIIPFFEPEIYNESLISVSLYESTNYVIFFLAFINLINEKVFYKILIYTFFISIYSLGKGIFLIQFLFLLPLVMFLRLKELSFLECFTLFFLFIINFLILWTVAGQSIYHLNDFIFSSLKFSSGYQYTLHGHEFLMDFMTVLIFLILIIVSLTKLIKEILNNNSMGIIINHFCYFLMEAFFIFVVFKHSVVCSRGYHASIIFWVFMLMLFPFIFLNFTNTRFKSYS